MPPARITAHRSWSSGVASRGTGYSALAVASAELVADEEKVTVTRWKLRWSSKLPEPHHYYTGHSPYPRDASRSPRFTARPRRGAPPGRPRHPAGVRDADVRPHRAALRRLHAGLFVRDGPG